MTRSRRRLLAAALPLTLASGLLVLSPSAQAVSPDVVISEVYGGGGNSGATLKQDFIELHNRGTETIDLSQWSVQYASSSGTTYQVTSLSGDIAPGEHYLIGEAFGNAGTVDLPTPDANGSIAMSGSSGKVALVTDATALTCGADCDSAAGVRDFVGYGSANDFEGSNGTGTLSATTSASRNALGTDTDDNAGDFTVGDPGPQNRNRPPQVTTIMEIQGADHTSPLAGQSVSDVPGIVTAVAGNGFYLQDTAGDADPNTSDAVFVFTGSAPAVAVGDEITVAGTVSEFRAGGSSSDNLTITEITDPIVTPGTTGQPLPGTTTIGAGDTPADRTVPGTVIDDDSFAVFDPANDGIDFWESLEAMRLRIDTAQVVGPTNRFDETPVVPVGATIRTDRGGIVLTADDTNPERILVDNPLADVPVVNVGDTYDSVIGVLDYSFANFKLYATESPVRTDNGLTRESIEPASADELSAAAFNVENLDPSDDQAKFDALAETIVSSLGAPDLLALEEVQDNTGATDDGTVAADQTIAKLVDAITAAGGPSYAWTSVDPQDKTDGGEPGGNIRVGFLYRTDRGLSLTERDPGDATTPTEVTTVDGQVALSHSPGRVAPNDPAWDDSRKPVAAEFTWRGRTFFAIANHFASKGGDDPLYGRTQPPVRSSEVQRHQQAQTLRAFLDDLLGADPAARVMVLGDLNDFEFSETVDILVGSGDTALTDLPRTLPANERYTYVFEGNSQVLDHIMVSPRFAADSHEYDVVHVNSEFADQVSDHEPQVLQVQVPEPRDTTLTLLADPQHKTYKDGTTVQLSGALSVGDDEDLSDHEVTLEASTDDGSSWTDVATKNAAADGSYEFTDEPEENTAYRVVYNGPEDRPGTSETVQVSVSAKVTIHPTANTVRKRQPVVFFGQVAPDKAGDVVRLAIRAGDGWRIVDTDTLDTYSEYELSFSTRDKGTYIARVVWAGDDDHAPAISDEERILVE